MGNTFSVQDHRQTFLVEMTVYSQTDAEDSDSCDSKYINEHAEPLAPARLIDQRGAFQLHSLLSENFLAFTLLLFFAELLPFCSLTQTEIGIVMTWCSGASIEARIDGPGRLNGVIAIPPQRD